MKAPQRKATENKKTFPNFILLLLCSLLGAFFISMIATGNVHIVIVQFSNHEASQTEGDDLFNYFPIQVHTNDEDYPQTATLSSNSRSHNIIPALFQTTNGDNWNIITFPTEFNFTEEELNVRWANFTSTTNVTRPMAIHPHFDYISRAINRGHHWVDCDVLPGLWNEYYDDTKEDDTQQHDPSNHPEKHKVYVEIGANIGSCVMEMLLSTNAFIVAFEPHPKNRVCLLQTISKLEPKYQERIIIVPIALGDKQESSTIYSASNNMGNSVVGQVIKDYDAQKFEEKSQFTIQIERLDSIFHPNIKNTIDIPLLKLDAQGYECRILEGMSHNPSIAKTIQQVKFEYAQKWIQGQNCSDLFPRLRDFGFDIYRGTTIVKDDESIKAQLVDLIARQSGEDG